MTTISKRRTTTRASSRTSKPPTISCGGTEDAYERNPRGEGKIDANCAKGVGAILGAIMDLKNDKLLRAENTSLREANKKDRRSSPPATPRPIPPPFPPRPHPPSATPVPGRGPKQRRDQVSRGPASPPATSRKPKAVMLESPPPTLMHSTVAQRGLEYEYEQEDQGVSTGKNRKAEERG